VKAQLNGGEAPPEPKKEEPPVENEDDKGEIFYDKEVSFFDNISCEAIERSKG